MNSTEAGSQDFWRQRAAELEAELAATQQDAANQAAWKDNLLAQAKANRVKERGVLVKAIKRETARAERAEQKSAELAAVITEAREALEHVMHPASTRCYVCKAESILSAVSADVLSAYTTRIREEAVTGRFSGILAQIEAEAARSIEKHGEQRHLPMGTGPETTPLEVMPHIGAMQPHVSAESLAVRATLDTKAHSQNEGGDGTVTWWHILREEVFEAAAEDDGPDLRAELVRVAAVALKMIDALDNPWSEIPEGQTS